jgi:hypothetical protein
MGAPAAQRYDSQSTLGEDSAYHGKVIGGQMDGSTNSFQDDIPLRDHPAGPVKVDTSTDHVYDAPAGAVMPNRMEEGRNYRNSGIEYKKPKKPITWVCWIFTLVQVVVFIVEIVKNGMFLR